jgi:hypothetical protein
MDKTWYKIKWYVRDWFWLVFKQDSKLIAAFGHAATIGKWRRMVNYGITDPFTTERGWPYDTRGDDRGSRKTGTG